MPPSNFFRAALPLRSGLPGSCTSSANRYMPTSLSAATRMAANASANSILHHHRTLTPTPTQLRQNTTTTAKTNTTNTDTSNLPTIRKYPYTIKTGTVTSVGHMDRTVRVAHRHTTLDPHIGKAYPKVTTFLVADPRESLREGDVIEFSSGYPKSRRVRHVVERIVAPFGSRIQDRPAVMSREERDEQRAIKRAAKLQRREKRRVEAGGQPGNVGTEYVGRIKRLIMERVGS